MFAKHDFQSFVLALLALILISGCGAPPPEEVGQTTQAGFSVPMIVTVIDPEALWCPNRPFLVFEEVKISNDPSEFFTPPSPRYGWWLDRSSSTRASWTLPWDAPEDAGRYHWAASRARNSFYHTVVRVGDPRTVASLQAIPIGTNRFFNLSSPGATGFVGTTATFNQYEVGFRITRHDSTSWSMAGFEVRTPNPGRRISDREYVIGVFPDVTGTGTRGYEHSIRVACMTEDVGTRWLWDDPPGGTSSLDGVTAADVFIRKVNGCYACENR